MWLPLAAGEAVHNSPFERGNDMYKIMVAEDEPLLRDGILRYLRRGEPDMEIVGGASDGVEACRLAEEKHPDIIITDINMPKLDGLQFIETINRRSPATILIIISGYADFTYAQKAIRLRVQDYLLKPVSPEDIHAVLQKAVQKLRMKRIESDQREQADCLRQQKTRLQAEQFLSCLVSGGFAEKDPVQAARRIGLDLQAQRYGVVRVKLRRDHSDLPGTIGEDRLRELILAGESEMSGAGMRFYGFWLMDVQPVWVVCLTGGPQEVRQERVAEQIGLFLDKVRGPSLKAWAVIGRFVTRPEDLVRSFREATDGLSLSEFADGAVIPFEKILAEQRESVEHPEEIERQLIVAIKLPDKDRSLGLARQLFDFFTEHTYSVGRVKQELTEIVVMVERELEKQGKSAASGRLDDRLFPYQAIQQCEEVDALRGWFTDFIESCCMAPPDTRAAVRGEQLIRKVKEMVGICLSDEHFSLDHVSTRLFISPNYLRQLFKQYAGMSFVEYLTRKRMEKAAELLEDPTLKIQDIAEQVGYTNQRYFAMCFKKYFFYTPTVYREMKSSRVGMA